MEITVIKPTFKEWLEEQPDSKVVNHSGWHSCAVGDYNRAMGFELVQMDHEYLPICIDPMKNYFAPDTLNPIVGDFTFFDLLNEGNMNRVFYENLHFSISNYGGLKDLLSRFSYVEPKNDIKQH